MPISNPGGSEKVKYLFIDGGCLESLLATLSDKLFGGRQVEPTYNSLAFGFHKVFYYDCLPAQKQDESDSDYEERIRSKIELFNHLKELNKFHVYEGTARFRDRRRGQEQKQVDIMIAVDMLSHSFRRNMHEATLLTGDLDFKPLIDALVQDGMYVSLWYPKGRTNYELIDAADSRSPMTIEFMQNYFLGEGFKDQLPKSTRLESNHLDPPWALLEKAEKENYEASFYKKEGEFAAVVPFNLEVSTLYNHLNLDQLKFYVDYVHSANVVRR